MGKPSPKIKQSQSFADFPQPATLPMRQAKRKLDFGDSTSASVSSTQKKKKHKKQKDRSYKPGDERRSNKIISEVQQEAILRMRTDNSTTFIDPKNKQKCELKTTVIYCIDDFEVKADEETLGKLVEEELKHIPTHRPIGDILKKNADGSPDEVVTPIKKTILWRKQNNGSFIFFDNRPAEVQPAQIITVKGSKFLDSETYHAVTCPQSDKKNFSIQVTKRLYQASKKEKNDNGGRRLQSQKKVMAKPGGPGVSANEYMQDARSEFPFPDVAYEYTHILPHDMIGEKKAQQPHMLLVATKASNTNNMFIERELKKFSSVYPEGYQFNTNVSLVPQTHIGINMQCVAITERFKFPAIFNMQDPTTPLFSTSQYIHAMSKSLINASKSVVKPNILSDTNDAGVKKPVKFSFFYRKEKRSDEGASATTDHLAHTKNRME